MSGTKSTPGPWAVRVEEQHYVTSAEGRIANVLFPRYSADGAEVMANARLIAAAPELLATLTKMVERITYYAELKEGDIPNIEDWAYTYNSGDMASARAAIAKATGGAA